jgi:hypothetical protein
MVGDGPRPPGHTSRRVGGGRAGDAGLPTALARHGCTRGLECNEVKAVELTVVAVVTRGGLATMTGDPTAGNGGSGRVRAGGSNAGGGRGTRKPKGAHARPRSCSERREHSGGRSSTRRLPWRPRRRLCPRVRVLRAKRGRASGSWAVRARESEDGLSSPFRREEGQGTRHRCGRASARWVRSRAWPPRRGGRVDRSCIVSSTWCACSSPTWRPCLG